TFFSQAATLTLIFKPVLIQHPLGVSGSLGPSASLTVLQGSTVAFTAATTGTLPLSYRWRWTPTVGSTTFNLTNMILMQSNATFTLFNVDPTNNGSYRVIVTNIAGASALSSNAVLTVLA